MTFEWDEEKGDTDMKKKTIYKNAPNAFSTAIIDGERVVDFLPPPEKLVRKEPKVKITITLNSGSIDFFKKHARKNKVKYQTMINEVLDIYVQRYKKKVV